MIVNKLEKYENVEEKIINMNKRIAEIEDEVKLKELQLKNRLPK